MRFKIKKNKNWDKFMRSLDPKKNKGVVDKYMLQATRLNGKVFEKQIRETIRNGNYKKNAPLTVAIKGVNKPLVGVETGATLFKAITSQTVSAVAIFIGVLKTNEAYNIAKTVHEGKTIKVTDKMRGLFLALWKASEGVIGREQLSERGKELFDYMQRGWKPLKKSTTRIIIPPRRFINQAFKDTGLRKIAERNWEMALAKAFSEIKRTS